MPFYDYKCEKCENITEEFLPIAERKRPEQQKCAACGALGGVFLKITGISGVSIDSTKKIDGKATGGFKEVMERVSKAPGIGGSKREKYLKSRWGL